MRAAQLDAIKLETYDRLKWLIKLRWAAITGLILIVLGMKIIFNLSLFTYSLAIIFFSMIVYNLIFIRLFKVLHKTNDRPVRTVINLTRFANLQIGLDLLFLVLIWYLHGGIENPIMFFFIFHMIIASILLPQRYSYMWAILSSVAVFSIALLEHFDFLKHYGVLSQLTGITLWDNLYWNIFILTAFCFSLIAVVFMTSSISSRLRKRNAEIIKLEKEISDKKLHAAERQLHVSEKMASLGKLAAGIAHEINNPLTTILSYSECLSDEISDNEELKEDIETIIGETIRIREIVKDILNFARASEESEPTNVNINDEIGNTIKMLQPQMNFISIPFDLHLSDDLPMVKVGEEHLKQVLINLFINASQAMKGRGVITIITELDKLKSTVNVKIKDTGPGIKEEHINSIFDPYFTTKQMGEGTGLGLAVSHGIIEMYGGDLSVESEYGKGAAFILSFPITPIKIDRKNLKSF